MTHTHSERMRRLARNDLLVLPYDQEGEMSTVTLGHAMASGVPVAVTPIAMFEEADDAVYRFDGNDAASMAAGINLLLHEHAMRAGYQHAASVWLEQRDWKVLARRLAHMMLGLRAMRPNAAEETPS
jgi:O-antigen biosynthesis alpha-1,2-mannosyltransferase